MNILTALNRGLSLLVAVSYIIFDCNFGLPGGSHIKVGLCVIFILSLIWFGDFYGSITGFFSHGSEIDKESPGVLVAMMGWFLLVGIPVVLYLVRQ